jgi:hypothetical protein
MVAFQPFRATRRGYQAASAPERAGFGMLSACGTTIAVARLVNYVRERRRRAPRLRSWVRRAAQAPRDDSVRIHHFLPGVAIAFGAGGAAILALRESGEVRLALPFGAGVGLTLDEIDLLLERANPYWRGETLAVVQSAAAIAAATVLGARFYRRGSGLMNTLNGTDGRSPQADRPDQKHANRANHAGSG